MDKTVTPDSNEVPSQTTHFRSVEKMGMVFAGLFALVSFALYLKIPSTILEVLPTLPQPSAMPTTLPSPSPQTHSFEKTTIDEPYAFVREKAVWLKKGAELLKISSDGQVVYEQVLSPDAMFLAYIWADDQAAIQTDAHTLTLVNLTTGESKNIYSVKGTEIPTKLEYDNFRFYDHISHINFSDDSQLFAFSTRQAIFITDPRSFLVKQVYINRDNTSARRETDLLYGMGSLSFSPDKTKLFVTFGYYEGVGSFVLNLQTKALKEVGNDYHGYGNTVLGWVDSRYLLTTKSYSANYKDQEVILSYDTTTDEEKELFILPKMRSYSTIILNNKPYLLTENLLEDPKRPLILTQLPLDIDAVQPIQIIEYGTIDDQLVGKIVIGSPFDNNISNMHIYSYLSKKVSDRKILLASEQKYYVYDLLNQKLELLEDNLSVEPY